MTLHRWHEQECGTSNDYGSGCIVRGSKLNGTFTHDDDGKPYLEWHHYGRQGVPDRVTYRPIDDKEAGARRRLEKIMKGYPSLSYFVQTDPRGCALYILRPDDVPAGATVDSCYSRGLAVHQ
jgi:hypothetical protein